MARRASGGELAVGDADRRHRRLALLLAYAGKPLRVAVIARWAARRAGAELDLLLPLITRALPLLLLFMMTLFINTEVWQVSSTLRRPSLYATVLVFAMAGAAFLLTRLPDEVREVQRSATTPTSITSSPIRRSRATAPTWTSGVRTSKCW